MRVIAGIAKGRSLKAVPGKNTRPTTDKVKESLFNILAPFLHGGVVLDLFAGTGGLGIEALSRGMTRAFFIDFDKTSIEVIRHNIEVCQFQQQSEVFRNDAERALKIFEKKKTTFDLIFLDPPYKSEKYERIIHFIEEHNILNKDGIIVAEHDSKLDLPENIGDYIQIKSVIYGNIGITIYQY